MKKRVSRQNWVLAFLFHVLSERILEEWIENQPFQDGTEKNSEFSDRCCHEEASQPMKLGVSILVHVPRETDSRRKDGESTVSRQH